MADIIQLNDTTYKVTPKDDPKDRIEVEIGDSKQEDFYPQTKLARWDNEVNMSFRLNEDLAGATSTYDPIEKKLKWIKPDKEVHFYNVDPNGELPEGGFEMEVILKTKPASNVLEYTINTKDLDFFYQPELTQAEIDEGCERPDNVIGSYAVYHKTKGGMNRSDGMEYRVGKAFHIYRPKIIDADNNWVWGELFIDPDAGIQRITIPQDFIDNAVYPIRHASGEEFGYHTIGESQTGSNADTIKGSKYTLSEAGEITAVYSYVKSNAGDTQHALYEGDNSPKLASTPTFTHANTTWRSGTLDSSYSASAGDYWLIGNSDTTGNRWAYDSDGGTSCYDSETYGVWPETLVPGSGTLKISFYAVYTPDASSSSSSSSSSSFSSSSSSFSSSSSSSSFSSSSSSSSFSSSSSSSSFSSSSSSSSFSSSSSSSSFSSSSSSSFSSSSSSSSFSSSSSSSSFSSSSSSSSFSSSSSSSDACGTLQDYINTDDDDYSGTSTNYGQWAAFTTSSAYTICAVRLKLFKSGSPGTLTVSIKATDGGTSKPTGADLCSGTLSPAGVTEDTGGDWYKISLGAGAALDDATLYAICIRDATDASNDWKWRGDWSSPPSPEGVGYWQTTDPDVYTRYTSYNLMYETYSGASSSSSSSSSFSSSSSSFSSSSSSFSSSSSSSSFSSSSSSSSFSSSSSSSSFSSSSSSSSFSSSSSSSSFSSSSSSSSFSSSSSSSSFSSSSSSSSFSSSSSSSSFSSSSSSSSFSSSSSSSSFSSSSSSSSFSSSSSSSSFSSSSSSFSSSSSSSSFSSSSSSSSFSSSSSSSSFSSSSSSFSSSSSSSSSFSSSSSSFSSSSSSSASSWSSSSSSSSSSSFSSSSSSFSSSSSSSSSFSSSSSSSSFSSSSSSSSFSSSSSSSSFSSSSSSSSFSSSSSSSSFSSSSSSSFSSSSSSSSFSSSSSSFSSSSSSSSFSSSSSSSFSSSSSSSSFSSSSSSSFSSSSSSFSSSSASSSSSSFSSSSSSSQSGRWKPLPENEADWYPKTEQTANWYPESEETADWYPLPEFPNEWP